MRTEVRWGAWGLHRTANGALLGGARRSIIGFLKSAEWQVPVLEFIDQNCIVFDTEDENKFEYTTIHKEFCDLVNGLLEGFLSGMGIEPEEFVQVCESDSGGNLNEFVFNSILSVDDFLSFKKMMVKRNCELNVQAMSMLAVRHTQLRFAAVRPALTLLACKRRPKIPRLLRRRRLWKRRWSRRRTSTRKVTRS